MGELVWRERDVRRTIVGLNDAVVGPSVGEGSTIHTGRQGSYGAFASRRSPVSIVRHRRAVEVTGAIPRCGPSRGLGAVRRRGHGGARVGAEVRTGARR